MDVKNWDRRGRLPEPVQRLAYGPVWEKAQFPAAVKRELLKPAANGRTKKSTTTPRSDTKRRTSAATGGTRRSRKAQPAGRAKRASARS
jgi:hypothetical protein